MALKKKARLAQEQIDEELFAASGAAEAEHQIAEWGSWRQRVGVRKPSNVTIVKKQTNGLGNAIKRCGIITLTQKPINHG